MDTVWPPGTITRSIPVDGGPKWRPREGELHVNYVPNAPTAFNRDSHQSTNTFVHEPSSLSSKWARIPEGFVASDSNIGSELDYSTILAEAASG
jgi:hypothetical protein